MSLLSTAINTAVGPFGITAADTASVAVLLLLLPVSLLMLEHLKSRVSHLLLMSLQ